MHGLIDNLIKEGWLKKKEIIEAFSRIKRIDFLPSQLKNLAEVNEALPIGYGQTISQPLVVAFMFELLQPKKGEKILDIGAGSGYSSALLGQIVGKKGKVIAIEIIPELVEFGKRNVAKYNFIKKGIVKFILNDGLKGYKKEAPFDKILCSAQASFLPPGWKDQLKIGGRIVTPIHSSIWLFKKISPKKLESKEYPGFAFVPLVQKK